jgi:hypothetical protein
LPEQQKSCLVTAGGFNYNAALHGASIPKSPTALTSEDNDRALVDHAYSVNHSRILLGSSADTLLLIKSALLSSDRFEPDVLNSTVLSHC